MDILLLSTNYNHFFTSCAGWKITLDKSIWGESTPEVVHSLGTGTLYFYVNSATYLISWFCSISPHPPPSTWFLGSLYIPAMDSLGIENGSAWWKNHTQDDNDAEQDEGARLEREVLQKPLGQRLGHGWRLQAILHPASQFAHPSSPSLSCPFRRAGRRWVRHQQLQ